MPGAGFEPATSGRLASFALQVMSLDASNLESNKGRAPNSDYEEFYQWLVKSRSVRVSRDYVNYVKRFKHCLFKQDLSDLMKVSDGVRRMAMFSLSALSKYLGLYDDWKNLVKRYGLKWAGKSKSDIMIERLTKVEDPGEVYEWIRQAKKARPELTEFLEFITITGLRLIEAFESYNLIIKLASEGNLDEYYNTERETLEHFRFKEKFIRRSKKAFVSFVHSSMIKTISNDVPLTSNDGIIRRIKSQGLRSRFGDVREAHGTFLTKFLKQPEIDFLHGRVSTNVFMRNYFNPALIADLKSRAFQGIKEIQGKIK